MTLLYYKLNYLCQTYPIPSKILQNRFKVTVFMFSWAKSIPQKNLFEGKLRYLQRGIWGNDPNVLLSFRSSRLANLRRRRCIYQKCTANRKYLDQNLPNGQHCQKFLLHPRYLHLLLHPSGCSPIHFYFHFLFICLLGHFVDVNVNINKSRCEYPIS